MTYHIVLKQRVIKALVEINEPHYSQIRQAIYGLVENPRPYGYIKLKGKHGYRIRVGDYRIIYDIKDNILLVEVLELGHRKEIYG